jgi:uncharacterized protein involved in exopolysaccharide biosynthesis
VRGPGKQRAVNLARLVWNRRKFLAKAVATGLVLAAIIAFLIPPRYQSEAQLMPPDSGGSGAMLAAASSKIGMLAGPLLDGLLGNKSSSALYVGVLQSRTISDDLVNRFDLRKVYKVSRMEDARKILAENTIVSWERKSGIVKILVTDRSPQRSADLAGAYVDELNKLMSSISTSSAQRERIFLEERLKGVTAELEKDEREFSEFASKNTAIDIKEQGRMMVETTAKTQGQLVAAEAQLEGLRQIYGEENARVKGARAQIAKLRSELQKMGGNAGQADNNPNSLYPSLRRLPSLGVTYGDLYRRMKVQEAVYETLTQNYELAKVQEAKDTPNVKVLDEPTIPERKSFPPRMAIMFIGGLLAFLFATAWICSSELWKDYDPEAPVKKLVSDIGADLNSTRTGYGVRRLFGMNGKNGHNGHHPSQDDNADDTSN